MRNRSRSSSALQRVLLFGTLAALFSSLSAAAAEKRRFDIAAGEARSTLNEFSRQADLQIYFDVDAVRRYMTQAVAGELEAADALAVMLGGTELIFEFVNERTVTVMRRGQEKQSGVPGARAYSGSSAAQAKSDDVGEQENSRRPSDDLEAVVVTGTRIRGVAPDSAPLITYTRQDIDRLGVANVEGVLRKIPQNFALVDGETFLNNGDNTLASGNNTRGSTVNLRGLGPGATLVLLNGRRLAPSGVNGAFVDTSVIPLSAIERIEILADGGSALYGADAVGGVVNFVLYKDFEGAQSSVRYGETTEGGGDEFVVSQALGHSWGSGNAMLSYEYEDDGSISASQRSFVPDQGGPYDLVPGQRRNSALVSARHELTSNTSVSAELLFSDRKFRQTNTIFNIFLQQDNGASKGVGGGLRLTQRMGDTWRNEVLATASETDEERDSLTIFGGTQFPSISNTDSKLRSIDLTADGVITRAPGGDARLSIGGTARTEKYDRRAGQLRTTLERDIVGAFVEAFVPFIGESNARTWASRLDLSLAARYDHYDDVGSSTDPKIGVVWSPLSGVNLRGTYTTALRPPPLGFLDPRQIYQVFALPDPTAADGSTVTLYPARAPNPILQPETSSSFTVGLDIKPKGIPDLAVSVTYFDIDFSDRIDRPAGGNIFEIFGREAVNAAPFVDRTPDPVEVQRIFAQETLENFAGATPADIEAFADLRLQNVAATQASGVDFWAEHQFALGSGKLAVFLSGTYAFDLRFQAHGASPVIERVNTVYNPVDLRARTGASYSWGDLASAIAVNYADHYMNDRVTPFEEVSSWTTLDWQLSYTNSADGAGGLLDGLAIVLDLQNATDEEPPRLTRTSPFRDLGFDGTNSTPRGRFVSLELRKRW